MLNLKNRGNHVAMRSLGVSAFALCGLPKALRFPTESYENQPLQHLFYFTDVDLASEANHETNQLFYSRLITGRRKACLQTCNRLVFNNKYLLLINSFIN